MFKRPAHLLLALETRRDQPSPRDAYSTGDAREQITVAMLAETAFVGCRDWD